MIEKEKPKCAICEENGVKYKTFKGPVYSRCECKPAFWDEDGVYHESIIIGITERSYNCSNEHEWTAITEYVRDSQGYIVEKIC